MVDETPQQQPEQPEPRPDEGATEPQPESAETSAAEPQESPESRPEETAAPPPSGDVPETREVVPAGEAATETEAPSAEESEASESSASAALDIGSEPAEEEEAGVPKPAPVIRGKVDKRGVAWGTGRRKTAVARVRIKDGNGTVKINGQPLEEYFRLERDQLDIEAPLKAAGRAGEVDVLVRVNGGGTTGQAGAVVLGVARALEAMDPELHYTLHEGGYLTRDDRMVERKKYGFKKARKSFQFSKR